VTARAGARHPRTCTSSGSRDGVGAADVRGNLLPRPGRGRARRSGPRRPGRARSAKVCYIGSIETPDLTRSGPACDAPRVLVRSVKWRALREACAACTRRARDVADPGLVAAGIALGLPGAARAAPVPAGVVRVGARSLALERVGGTAPSFLASDRRGSSPSPPPDSARPPSTRTRIHARRPGAVPGARHALAVRPHGRRGRSLARGIRGPGRRSRGRSSQPRRARRGPRAGRSAGARSRDGDGARPPPLPPASDLSASVEPRPATPPAVGGGAAATAARAAARGASGPPERIGRPLPRHRQEHAWRHARVRLRRRRSGAAFQARRPGSWHRRSRAAGEPAVARSIQPARPGRARGRSPGRRRSGRRGRARGRRSGRGSRARRRRGRRSPGAARGPTSETAVRAGLSGAPASARVPWRRVSGAPSPPIPPACLPRRGLAAPRAPARASACRSGHRLSLTRRPPPLSPQSTPRT
jgi:hypothetical protein